jgi:hypothetical protein
LGCRESGEIPLTELVEHAVVEEDVGAVQPGGHQVLVVAGIADQGGVGPVAVGHTGNVLVDSPGADLQPGSHRAVRVGDIENRRDGRSTAEDRVEIERESAAIRGGERVLGNAQEGSLVEGDVMVGELTDEGRARGHGGIVRVGAIRIARRAVPVDGGVHDQRLRTRRQVVTGVEDPPG